MPVAGANVAVGRNFTACRLEAEPIAINRRDMGQYESDMGYHPMSQPGQHAVRGKRADQTYLQREGLLQIRSDLLAKATQHNWR